MTWDIHIFVQDQFIVAQFHDKIRNLLEVFLKQLFTTVWRILIY